MNDLPSFRARGAVGRVERDGSVTPSRELVRYLDLIAQRASEVSVIQETTTTAVGFATYPAQHEDFFTASYGRDEVALIVQDYDAPSDELTFAEYT